MSDTLTLPPPVERKCSIEEVFDPSFIELLKLVPANPYVRALILKFTGKLPPIGMRVVRPVEGLGRVQLREADQENGGLAST
jgi:hypothetical protein